MKSTFSLSAMMAFFAILWQAQAAAEILQNPKEKQEIRMEFIHNFVEEAAAQENLEPALLMAIIQVESNFDHKARSKAGAKGLMQLMPNTALELGYGRALDYRHPRFNILAGARYLREMINLFQ